MQSWSAIFIWPFEKLDIELLRSIVYYPLPLLFLSERLFKLGKISLKMLNVIEKTFKLEIPCTIMAFGYCKGVNSCSWVFPQ